MSRYEEIKNLWKNKLSEPNIETESFACFCYDHRCPHRDYSLCPKDCEKPGPKKPCPQGDCQIKLKHPKECEKQTRELQEKAGEKLVHIDGQPIITRRLRKR